MPLIVTVEATTTELKPAGKLDTEALVALPPKVYTVLGITVPEHTVGFCVPLVKTMVEAGFTVTARSAIVPVPHVPFPVARTVKLPVTLLTNPVEEFIDAPPDKILYVTEAELAAVAV